MNTASLIGNLVFNVEKPTIQVLLETATSKEIRIAMQKGQFMKEHKAPYPIVIEIFEGIVDFGINGLVQHLKKGDLIALDANVPHDLKAIEQSIVRLTLSKFDHTQRIKNVIK